MGRATNRILLVEDSEDDEILFRRTLIKAGIKNPLKVFRDGLLAMSWLKRGGCPRVVFVDLKMPGIDGMTLLEWMTTQAALEKTLFVVLTGLDTPRQLKQAYQVGAHSYLPKPISEADLTHLIKHFDGHWEIQSSRPRRAARKLIE
jgi:CheY-like chemotaxis protein